MKKRILACLMAAMMILTGVSVEANAAGKTGIAVKADKTEAVAGDVITYTVEVSSVPAPGAAGMEFDVVIPEGLTLVAGSDKVADGAQAATNAAMIGFYNMKFTHSYNGTTFTSNAATKVATFQCKVDEGFEGKNLAVSIKKGAMIYDADLNDFEVTTTAATVAVVEKPCDHAAAEWKVKNAATCGTDGVKELVCPKCGVIDEEVIPATGNHTWNEGEVTTEATCGADGVKTYTCTVCEKTKTEVIPATGLHVDENKDCVCDNCEASLDHVDENKDDVCDICGAELKKPVNDGKEEHKHVDANNDGKCDTCGKEIEASKTGDNANVALYAIMMAAAAAVVVYKKRRVEA